MASRHFSGKRVLVTGGSSGIGRALAHRLASEGAHVVVAARSAERLDAVKKELHGLRPGTELVDHVVFDASSPESVHEAVTEATRRLGGLDVLFANQGFARTGYFEDVDAASFDAMMQTNFFGHVELTRAALPHLKESGGALCLTSSMLGFMGTIGYSAYSASKHAVAGFARCIRGELAQDGITVTVGYVPTTDTPGLESENATKPADTWALESTSTKFPPEFVARELMRATARGKFEVTPGLSSRIIWRLYQWFPGLVHWIVDRDVAAFHQKERALGRDPRRPALLTE